jgi:BP28CT (NUC211) domain
LAAITKRCKAYGKRASINRKTVISVLGLVPTACEILRKDNSTQTLFTTISCLHQVVKVFGAKDHEKVLDIVKVLADKCVRIPELRLKSLQTLGSSLEILRTEALPMLPTVLDEVFGLLKSIIEEDEPNVMLHSACLEVLHCVTENITLAMSGRNLCQTVDLVLSSIDAEIDDKDNIRDRLCQSLAQNVNPGELFSAIEQWFASYSSASWNFSSAIASIQLAIVSLQHHRNITPDQSKIVFRFILDALKIRTRLLADQIEKLREDEVDSLEQKIIDLLVVCVPKVSNKVLHPFFAKMMEWISTVSETPDVVIGAMITSSKVMLAVQEKLKVCLSIPTPGLILTVQGAFHKLYVFVTWNDLQYSSKGMGSQ